MVRRGSTVRVRQRASAKTQHVAGFGAQNDLRLQPRAVGMEPFMELSRTRDRASARHRLRNRVELWSFA